MSTGDLDSLFEMDPLPERTFAVGDEVLVETLLGPRPATIEWIGRVDGFPAARVQSGGGTYTVSACRLRPQEEP